MGRKKKLQEGQYTWEQICDICREHNRVNNIVTLQDNNPVICVVVYSSDNWPDKDYSLESRSYEFSSCNKAFISGMGGYSIFAESLDKSDFCRIERCDWKVDYCYIVKQ